MINLRTIDNFLSTPECDRLVSLAAGCSQPPKILSDPGHRTNSTSYLSLLNDPQVLAIEHRIADALGVPFETSEGMQVNHYEKGQQYKPHFDAFIPGTKEAEAHAALGNRTYTFMVYLNDELSGGETEFCRLNLKVKPNRGMALIWYNPQLDWSVNPYTLHAGLPVESGRKDIINLWFRDRRQRS